MTAKQVYDDVYNFQLQQGIGIEEAKKIAGQSAANTARLNVVLMTPLNMTSIASPFMKPSVLSKEVGNKILGKLNGATTAKEMLERLGTMSGIATKKNSW